MRARLALWLLVFAGLSGAYLLGFFDAAPGPTAEEVEAAIAEGAPPGIEITVDCPDDAEDTPVDGTFTCIAAARGGRTVEVDVTNHGDTFEWDVGPLTTLA